MAALFYSITQLTGMLYGLEKLIFSCPSHLNRCLLIGLWSSEVIMCRRTKQIPLGTF